MSLSGPIHLGLCPEDLSTSVSIVSQWKGFENSLVLEQFNRRGQCIRAKARETLLLPAAGNLDQLMPKSRSTISPCPVTVTERSEQVIIKRPFSVEPWDQTLQAGVKSLSAESGLDFCGLFFWRSVGHGCGEIWYVICVLESWLNA